jgi:hypothetical protein
MMGAVSLITSVLGAVAPYADCEAFHAGLLRQPVNAWTSLALLAAGAWILLRAARREPDDRAEQAAFGAGIVFVGIGSVVLHGPDPSWALWFHDLGVLSVLLLLAVRAVGRVLGWPIARRFVVVGAGIAVLAFDLAVVPTSTVPAAWALVLIAALGELVAHRRRDRSSPGPRARSTLRLLAIATVAVAGAAYLFGRSASPLCNPDSLLQWHAVWHVLVAASAVLAAAAAGHDRPRLVVAGRVSEG